MVLVFVMTCVPSAQAVQRHENWGVRPPCLLTAGSANALLCDMGGTSSDTPYGFELLNASFFSLNVNDIYRIAN